MSIFLNNDAQLRSGWKFAAYVVFFLLIWFGTGIALSILVAGKSSEFLENQLVVLALNEIALFIPAVAAMWLCVRFADHRPFRTFGIGFLPGWRRDFLLGLGAAAAMWALLIGGCFAFGYVSIHWTGNQASLGTLLATFALLLLAAATAVAATRVRH